MKKFLVAISVLLYIFLVHANVYAFSCSIVNEEGNPITIAKAGDVVYLKASFVNLKSGKMTWKLTATVPTINSKNYKVLVNNSGYYYHVGSSQAYDNLIPIAIPAFDYIKGTAYFIYSLSKAGKCSLPLYISEYEPLQNTYTITATAGSNGSIAPSGTISVNEGTNRTFNITPNTNYHVADVLVDGLSVGAVASYTFNNVTANHTISASFTINTVTHTITASAGANGSISPSGAVTVNHGSNQSFTITPNTNYHVADVLVDGSSVGAVTSYTFTNVTSNRTINASFTINASDPIYDKTLLLKGHWHFAYTIISTFTDDYFLTSITGEKNSQGGYYIYGTDEYSGAVIAAYYPTDGFWALLDPGSIIDLFYVFYTDGVSILPGSCYYQAKNGAITSACYKLSGYKTALSEQNISIKDYADKIIGEQIREQETEPASVDPSIVEKYFIMKGMMR
jgi:hypothetical protein